MPIEQLTLLLISLLMQLTKDLCGVSATLIDRCKGREDDVSCQRYVNKHYYCHHEWMQQHCCNYCNGGKKKKSKGAAEQDSRKIFIKGKIIQPPPLPEVKPKRRKTEIIVTKRIPSKIPIPSKPKILISVKPKTVHVSRKKQNIKDSSARTASSYCARFWCPSEGDAVCATNGKTYTNRCKLKKAILCGKEDTEEAYEGYCWKPNEPRRKCSRCLPYHQPVCATDGKTYLNDCFLQNAISCNGRLIKFLYRGRCRQSPITCPIDCPAFDHSIICATDGYTYTRCELENERLCKRRALHSYHGGWCMGITTR